MVGLSIEKFKISIQYRKTSMYTVSSGKLTTRPFFSRKRLFFFFFYTKINDNVAPVKRVINR